MSGFAVDEELCIQCGLCTQDCVFGLIEMNGFPAIADESRCIGCQHCLAVCPTGAISIMGKSAEDCDSLKGTLPDEDQMSLLIRGRRSVRMYRPEPIAPERIGKLVETAWNAPTGVNSQSVLVTLMDDPAQVRAFSDHVYGLLDVAIRNGTMPDISVSSYLEWALKAKENGVDVIFREAPHLIIASAPKDAPTPTADTIIFLSYFELMANSMKIGTLWNGFLHSILRLIFPELKTKLGIPEDHEIGYAMIFGKPALKYARTVDRGPARINRVEWAG
ncbi:nitroreductase family protein [Maridesulfovibrio sp.]|uniref:nitroreductase family protein n=1 Tax=Maridesulfovibrio sp. TaxID=2795000 RepID=UPI002A18B370|nr:nitroreductase family protein [Maridesulfovibrio sp.]